MKIVRRKVDGGVERRFLMGAIVSDRFLKEALPFYDPDLIEVHWVRTVAEWCFQYFQKYNKAPGIEIKAIYDAKASRMDPTESEMIAELLSSISNEFERSEKLNVQYLLDQAEQHFKTLSLTKLAKSVSKMAENGDVEEAESALADYKRVGRPMSLGANPFRNPETIQKAFEAADKPLFTLPGSLGEMLNHILGRDQFLAFLGPEKRGKSWILNEIALRATKARCNVALFQIGDMSEDQVVVRLGIRLAGKSDKRKYCGEIDVPVLDCIQNQEGTCRKCPHKNASMEDVGDIKQAYEKYESGKFSNHKSCSECAKEWKFKGTMWWQKIDVGEPLKWREVWKVGNRLLGRIKGRDFKLSCHPSEQLSMTGLKGVLDNWEAFENFIPDVIVIDYADNLMAESNKEDYRHQINRQWKMMRALSQERHCLVVTATQAGASAYGASLLTSRNFSEDKRKFAHVTGFYGLNQTSQEKKIGVMRINPIVVREGEFFAEDVVSVAQSLKQGRPVLFSF